MNPRWYAAYLACLAVILVPLWFLAGFPHWNRWACLLTGVAAYWAARAGACRLAPAGPRRG